MGVILIADSGSTKTDWLLLYSDGKTETFRTQGMNPVLQTDAEMKTILEQELTRFPRQVNPDKIVFYGAGMKDNLCRDRLVKLLSEHFSALFVFVHSDLLAAARATSGNHKGVCCILGTGSNSGYYNGEEIKYQNPSLGYIIGDEGSGAFLGKRILQYYFYRTFDEELSEAFEQSYGNDLSPILDRVYRESMGNRYLASFAVFLKEHRGHYMIENILEDAFIDFHQRHILKYRESWKYPIHFCGSIAYEFRDVLQKLHLQYGLETGNIVQSPLAGLAEFHKKELATIL